MFNAYSSNSNFNLLIVGVAIAAIALLGFTVFFNDRKSRTNRAFFYYAIAVVFWGISNYLEYQFQSPTIVLFALRAHIAISVLYCLTFFRLAYVFPWSEVTFPRWHRFFVFPLALVTMVVAFTPLTFKRILSLAPVGEVTPAQTGPGMGFFGIMAFGLLVGGLAILWRKRNKSSGVEKKQITYVWWGMLITALLTLTFNFVLPVLFNNVRYIPFAALFVLPFISLISYTIYRHQLFNVKVAAVALVTFILTVFSLFNVIYATSTSQVVFNVIFFTSILAGSVLLIRSILREIEQREKLEILDKELETANEKLKELDKLKTEFLSLASHQLRSPLTAVKGYTSMLLEGDFGAVNPQQKEAIDRVYQSVTHLTRVVEDLLNVTKIELGGMQYTMRPFDLDTATEELVSELRVTAEKKGLKLIFDCDTKKSYPILGDEEKLRQVFLNFIDNSIKYTEKGEVRVSVTKDTAKNQITFAVTDTGMGMTPETQASLFQKFVRTDKSKEVNRGGSGLGLYLAKQIVEAHHGSLIVSSPGVGKGSTFGVVLSLASPSTSSTEWKSGSEKNA